MAIFMLLAILVGTDACSFLRGGLVPDDALLHYFPLQQQQLQVHSPRVAYCLTMDIFRMILVPPDANVV
jgi:hypothetical protein